LDGLVREELALLLERLTLELEAQAR